MFERDDFYELADEKGIMVWEEGKFACSNYPRDKAFLQSVRTEVADQLRRLSHHPSIVIYSGNNENQKNAETTPTKTVDYSVLYDDTFLQV
jgi:beta-mannosidase